MCSCVLAGSGCWVLVEEHERMCKCLPTHMRDSLCMVERAVCIMRTGVGIDAQTGANLISETSAVIQ